MAQVTRKLPWHRRLSLRWALVFTTLLCALAGFLLLALETAVLEEARDAIYYKYITPYYAEESATGDLYVISPDGITVYVEATMPYAYVDPDTGETYPLADTPSSQFVPAGPLRFFYQHVGEIALGVYVATAVLCFFADAWWFYHWKIKKPLSILNHAAQEITDNNLDFQIADSGTDELGRLCHAFEIMRRELVQNNRNMWNAVEERKRLNAAFAHDLKTPLTVIQGHTDLLVHELGDHLEAQPELLESITSIQKQIKRLNSYVSTMGDTRPLTEEERSILAQAARQGISRLLVELAQGAGISPQEIEQVIRQLKWVCGVKVIGIPAEVLQEEIAYAETHMKTIEREMKELIAADSNICRNYKLLTSIKGVGPITAIVMLCSTLNFTKITDHRKFACYCGLAPFEHSSGTSVRGGCHTSSMANRDIKVQLNRSALIAIRCDPQLKAYYERKVAEGKHKFSVLNAVRAKIAARCFAVVRRGTPYVALQI